MSAFKNSPCKDCKDRVAEPNCHTTCKRYLEEKAKYNEKKQQIYDAKMQDAVERDRANNKYMRKANNR